MAEDEDNRLLWSIGLPNADDLTPLTLQLIPSELASAFKISPESSKTVNDVNRASENTFSSLQRWHSQDMAFNEETVTEKDETEEGFDPRKIRRVGSGGGGCVEDADSGNFAAAADDDEGSDPMKFRRVGSGGVVEDADSGNCAAAVDLEAATEDDAKMLKRARLVWTPQLHKRFIEVVAHLGIKNAVPKTIMQLMNVEGLTRENVASHLQKYRLYLKRQLNDHPHHHQGNSNSSEQSRNNNTNGHGHVAMNTTPMAYPPQQMMGYGGGGQPGFQHQYHNQYGNTMMQQQQREWSGNNFGYYHPVASNDK